MDKAELLALYEATGDEAVFREALPLYEEAVAYGASAQDLVGYGYLLESHGRNEIRLAVKQYELAVELDTRWPKREIARLESVL